MNPRGVIAMPRTGHRAVMEWMRRTTGAKVKNIEGFPFERSMERANIQGVEPWLLIRDYPNWLASCLAHFPDHVNMPPMIDAWITHAQAVNTIPTILFSDWVAAGHGKGIEGYESAFDGGSLMTRYEQMAGNANFKRYMERTDALNLSIELFPGVRHAA